MHDIFELIKMAISGAGKFRVNGKLKELGRILKEQYHYEADELVNYVYQYYRESGVARKMEGKNFPTFMTYVTYYSLKNLEKKLRREKELIQEDFNSNGHEIRGAYSQYLIENTSDGNDPESLLYAKEMWETLVAFVGEDLAQIVIGKKTRKEKAEELGVDYKHFCRQFSKKLMEFEDFFKQEGYEIKKN